jgi:hypothetical protein
VLWRSLGHDGRCQGAAVASDCYGVKQAEGRDGPDRQVGGEADEKANVRANAENDLM